MQTTTTETKPTTETPKPKRRRKRSEAKKAVAPAQNETRAKMWEIMKGLDDVFVGRSDSLNVISLALLTRNNFLLVGDPGTAKTALIQAYVAHITGASYFQALCGSFTTLDELVGPPDIKAFQSGAWNRVTTGMLPESDFAFLDEVMKSNDGTINSLLTILNERRFANQDIPLWSVGAATNWPEIVQRTEKVEALYDRFVLRHHVECMKPGDDHTKMLKAGSAVAAYKPVAHIDLDELKQAQAEVDVVAIPDAVYEKLTDVVDRLKKQDVLVSDRRAIKALRIMQASAWLDGRDSVSLADFTTLRYVLWNDKHQIAEVEAVIETLDQAVVQQCTKRIDKVMAAADSLRSINDRHQRLAKTSNVLRDMKLTAKEVKNTVDSIGVTKASREKIAKLMQQLKTKYEQLVAVAAKEVE